MRAFEHQEAKQQRFEEHHRKKEVDSLLAEKAKRLRARPEFAWATKKWPRILQQASELNRLPFEQVLQRFEIMGVESRRLVVNLLPDALVERLAQTHMEVLDYLV